MITIYTKSVTKRLQFTVDFIFNEICSLPFIISNDIQTLNGFVINYSDEQIMSHHIIFAPLDYWMMNLIYIQK
tara:strand:+ start:2023 stop:2241 length:219 start_codon:yes stop_codon:yes gene_type:complete